jgi:hypothetical protein
MEDFTMRKMNQYHIALVLFLSIFILTACGLMDLYSTLTNDDQGQVDDIVQATLTAIAAENEAKVTEASSPTATEEILTPTPPTTGMITGQLAYPGEFLPPQRVVAFDINDLDTYFAIDIPTGNSYTLEVPTGKYYLLAYLINPSQAGAHPNLYAGYTQAVLCGLNTGCEDHNLVVVDVLPGETTAEINPVDWYLPSGEQGVWPPDPTKPAVGSISGALGYPSEYIPPQRVIAFDVNSKDYQYVDTLLNQNRYEITDLPTGTYNVVAYVREQGPDFSGGYSNFVICGMNVNCNDHSLIDVWVYPGQETEDVDPVDFYAEPGSVNWPANPTQ